MINNPRWQGILSWIYGKYKPVEDNFVRVLEFAFCPELAVPQHSSTPPSTGALLVMTSPPAQQALECGILLVSLGGFPLLKNRIKCKKQTSKNQP